MQPGPQFQQLDMFKPAFELRDGRQTTHLDRYPDEHHNSLFDSKLRESENEGLVDSIRAHGVQEPVEVSHGLHDPWVKKPGQQVLSNGHHRVAVAHHLDPKMLLPVVHATDEQYDHEARARGARAAGY